ncbi:MAG: ATP-binding protein [Candidatus Eremiobacteraeota bacterium]|nr:ATP-binding protein [Candidatus Eremiobacteraeota bacterium]
MQWTFDSQNAFDALEKRASFMAFLREWGGAGEDFSAAEVVYGELIGNVVRHAPGAIEIVLDVSGRRPSLHVSDRGPGFAYAGGRLSATHEEGGRGMFLVTAFSDNLSVETSDAGGSCVSVELRICRAPVSEAARYTG